MGILPLVLLSLVLPGALANVYSCAGFVKSSSAIDYSELKVKLLTVEGHLKHEEEVNAPNGYFMIPVYNKGQYILKVSAPAEPDTINIKIDGKTDACSTNEDLIFQLTGFSVHGTVDGAPAGLSLVLTENGKQIASTKTVEGGKYEMHAPPGKYEVATGADASECISRGKTAVEVKNSPVLVTPNLKISGYQLEIASKTVGLIPFTDAVMTLYSTSPLDLPNIKCVKSEGASNVPSTHNFKCPLGKTDPRGRLPVACVPSGTYYLVASHENGPVSITFSSNPQQIEISQKAAEARFVAESATGRVRVVSKDLPLAGIEVVVNGKQSGKTDSEGYLVLKNLRENEQTTVTAQSSNVQFNTVTAKVQFPKVEIEDIKVQKFEICGRVEKAEDGKLEKLIFTRKDDKRNLVIEPKPDGSFCQAVSPGQFTIEPNDKTSSLTPRLLEIDVLTKPVTDLRFTHFKTNANVHVSCIGACPTATISLYLPGQTLVRSVKGTDVFVFENIGPGTYSARLDDNGRGCWEESEMTLNIVQSKTQPTIHFKQNGFAAQIEISHPAEIDWANVDKKQLNGKTKTKGGEVISICVPTSGVYDISLDSCYKFEKQKFQLTVPFEGVHKEKAVAARITGQIDLENDKNAAVSIRVKSSAGDREIQISPSANGKFTFEEPLASSGEQLLLVPTSKVRLFEPTSKSVTVTGKCVDNIATFKSFRGIFLDGSIKPAVEGAFIKAVLKSDRDVVIDTVSTKDGRFKIGPVKRVEDYDITATLDGYKFTSTSTPGHFDSVKLSQLSIKVVDEITNEPLDGVLLSLVGGKGAGSDYRSNNVLDETAQKNFVALAPGEYFVRAILQEYKFSPSTSTISVKEGQHENVVLKGKRVSFSAFGKMREMSGNPVKDVIIEALSQGCDLHQSEATSNQDGTYRIRGLLPNCEYQVYAKSYVDGSHAPHTFPRQFTVSMTPEDVKGLEFMATKTQKTTDIAVEIGMDTLPEIQSVRVVITKNNNEHVQATTVVAPQHLHYLVNLPRDGVEYAIRVEPERPPQAFAAKTVRVVADQAMKVARVPLTTSKRLNDVDISIGTFLSLPFFVSLALIFFNQNRAMEFLEAFFDWIRATFIQNNGDAHQRKRK
uniref:Nodal modulator 1 n=1 Tax=Caenorhabditis tropicalis TaxID=1561998 RepID=A0A1I7TY93_9PELO